MEFAAERRRFGRVRVSLEVYYSVRLPETGELLQGYGRLKDFSLSGLYFFTEPPVSLFPGQILTLMISASLPHLDLPDISYIKARGEVMRLEPFNDNDHKCGIAINFLESPTFSTPSELWPEALTSVQFSEHYMFTY